MYNNLHAANSYNTTLAVRGGQRGLVFKTHSTYVESLCSIPALARIK